MKCFNCKKEIQDGSVYCIYCGERLLEKSTQLVENYTVDNQKVYENIGNTTSEYGDKIKENLPGYIDKTKAFISKNKIASIIAAVIIVALCVGAGILNYMHGRPESESELKASLAGQTIIIDGDSYEIESGQVSSLTINSRNSVKGKSDTINAKITLDLDNASVETDINLYLLYNSNSNKWMIANVFAENVESIKPKVELKDDMNELLKDAHLSCTDKGYSTIDLNSDLIKSVDNVKVTESSKGTSGSADVKLSNGVVEAVYNVKFDARFKLKEGKWSLNSTYLSGSVVKAEELISNLSDDDKKKFVMESFTNNKSVMYKYKSRNNDATEYISIGKNSISNLTISNFMKYDNDTIRAEIQGEASSGDIKNIKFSGVLYLKLSLNSKGSTKDELNIDSLELNDINNDSIKKDLLKQQIDNKTITVDVANTLNLGAETSDSSMFDKIYEGTLTVNGESKNIKIEVTLKLNSDSKKYEWKLYRLEVKK